MQLFVSSQSTSVLTTDYKSLNSKGRDAASLELMMKKAAKQPALAQGIMFLLPVIFADERKSNEFLKWAIGVVRESIRREVDPLANID